MKIERPKKFGGNIEFGSYEKLGNAFVKGELHPADLKAGVSDALEKLIKPVMEHFEKNKKANKLYNSVKNLQITR